MRSSPLPVSALVTSRNEAAALARCLPTLAFCDELIVIDLESDDATADVAAACGARVIRHPPVPIAEWARAELAGEARHDWLLFIDPDEEIPPALRAEIEQLFPTLGEDVGAVSGPRQYYFGKRALRGTIWGGVNKRRLLVRRSAVSLTPTIWGGTTILDGYREVEMPFTAETAIAHRWVTGYRDWIGKHVRYLRLEPVDRANAGEVTGLRAIARTPWQSFRECFLTRRGYLDGLTGLGLSLLWALFRTSAETALYVRLRRTPRLPSPT